MTCDNILVVGLLLVVAYMVLSKGGEMFGAISDFEQSMRPGCSSGGNPTCNSCPSNIRPREHASMCRNVNKAHHGDCPRSIITHMW